MNKQFIQTKLMEARKAQNKVMESVYGQILNKILVAEKSGKYQGTLPEEVIIELAKREIKEMEETLSFYKEENTTTQELHQKINEIKQYLPAELSEDQVIEIIKQLAATESNKGKLIGMVCKQVGSNFDRSKVAPLVNKVLGG